MAEQPVAEYRIEDLAQLSGATVRTIRAYQDRGLLPKPERRGRSNIYGTAHLTRLRRISGLLDRGYTLASIGELLEAWDTGRGLGGVLGLVTAEVREPWPGEKSAEAESAEPRRVMWSVDTGRLHRNPADDGTRGPRNGRLTVALPAGTIRAVESLVGPENTVEFITAATERELQARTLDALVPRPLTDN